LVRQEMKRHRLRGNRFRQCCPLQMQNLLGTLKQLEKLAGIKDLIKFSTQNGVNVGK